MTDYSTDFSEYTTGVQPSDWTERWHTGVATGLVIADAGAEGGKLLRIDHSSAERYAISWDDVGDVADVEILAKVRWSDNLDSIIQLVLRGSGTTGETGYIIACHQTLQEVRLTKFDGGAATTLATISKQFYEDVWYMIRFRANGTTLQAKVWVAGGAEPTIWMIDETNSALSTGWVAHGSYRGDYGDCDWFGVSTGGDSVTNPFGDGSVAYHSTDFSEYATGPQPSDWTERWHVAGAASKVLEDAGASEGGKLLRVTHGVYPADLDRYLLSWDDLDGPDSIEILAKIRWSEDLSAVVYLVVRASGTSNENGYVISIDQNLDQIRLIRYLNGAALILGSNLSVTLYEDTWYVARFRAEGAALKFKIWELSDSEPESWDKEETDYTIDFGWAGFGSFRGENSDCDWFGVATNGGSVSKTFVAGLKGQKAGFFLVL